MVRLVLMLGTFLLIALPAFTQKYNHVKVDTLFTIRNQLLCHSIYAPNDSTIWADFASVIYRSTNRGVSWETIEVPNAVRWSSLRPLNADTAFFSAMYSGFYRTMDGGKTWEDMHKEANYPNHFHFFDINEGMMLDAKLDIPYQITGIRDTLRIWITPDGGYSWMEVKEPDRPGFLPGEMFYHHANNMNRQAQGDTIFFGTSLGRLFMSYDRGHTWEAFYTGLGEGQFIISVAHHGSKNIMVQSDGGYYGKAFKSSFTNDGGATWDTHTLPWGASGMAAIPGQDSSFLLLNGQYHTGKGLLITHDGGKSYKELFDIPCHTMTFVNDSTAFMPSNFKNQTGGLYLDYMFKLTFQELPVHIPDTAFLYALIEHGVDTNGDKLISYEEAEIVKSLDLSGAFWDDWESSGRAKIEDLTGIEAFTNLDSLSCPDHALLKLDVSTNSALSYINCNGNMLSELEFSGNPELVELWCENNPLIHLDLLLNVALEVLDCSGTQLETLDISNNRELSWLMCDATPSLTEVCVWTMPFPPDGVKVEDYGCPDLYYTTECHGTSYKDDNHSGLFLFPNPANDILSINFEKPVHHSIEIVSINGQLLWISEIEKERHQIDLSGFEKGVYFITIRSTDFVRTEKIIKL